jgi:hypothetical protein
LIIPCDSTIYRKRGYVYSERYGQLQFPAKPVSVTLAVILALTVFQIPVVTAPLFSVFNITREGNHFSANIRYGHNLYFGTAYQNGSKTLVTGMYGSAGLPVQGSTYFNCLEMAPIANGEPLRIPECGGYIYWAWYLQYCQWNPTFAGCINFSCQNDPVQGCTDSSYFEATAGPCIVPPYTSNCESASHLHLDNATAINGQTALIVIAFLTGIIGGLLLGPPGAVAGLLPGLLAIGYNVLYANDMNKDKSFDLWTPLDWGNVAAGTFGLGFDAATPHFWWTLYGDTIPVIVGNRS